MEVCKADLGLALAQNFKKGCREARADLRYEGRNRSEAPASLRELVHLDRRRGIDGPVHWEDGEGMEAWVQAAATSVHEGAGGLWTLY